MKNSAALLFTLVLMIPLSFAQETIPLYPEGIKNHRDSDEKETSNNDNFLWIEKVQVPTLQIFLPSKSNRTDRAVVICPGGGYAGLAYDWEGSDIAKWFNSKGIAAFVVKYRLPGSKSVVVRNEAPLQDVQRAMRIVRANAEKWGINPHQIGVMGFSAGGHLASTLGTHFDFEDEKYFNPNSIDTVSARPDFMILMYPVITMDASFTHQGSKDNLLGPNPSPEMVKFYSNELQITDQTPPTFLVHSSDDNVVPVQNSLEFYKGLQKHGIYSEMHIYPYGGHGFSLAIGKGHLQGWPDLLYDWILSLKD